MYPDYSHRAAQRSYVSLVNDQKRLKQIPNAILNKCPIECKSVVKSTLAGNKAFPSFLHSLQKVVSTILKHSAGLVQIHQNFNLFALTIKQIPDCGIRQGRIVLQVGFCGQAEAMV
jgi:hypothetical protein